jgi:hypothetical protein
MGEPAGVDDMRIAKQLYNGDANFHKTRHGCWDQDSMSNG